MSHLQDTLSLLGLGAIVLLNVVYALPPMYKGGLYHRVGPGAVSVYRLTGGGYELPVAVQERREGSPCVDTGERVQVYLRSTYKDDRIVQCPRLTLVILAITN
jgi:hypothetical protein